MGHQQSSCAVIANDNEIKYAGANNMVVALTQSDFKAHMKKYLDRVNDEDETIYIARANSRSVAVISQEKMDWMEKALQVKEDSLNYAVARDQLIRRHVLPDDPIITTDNDYWEQFK